MAEDLRAELYAALKGGDPQAYRSSGMVTSGKRWVLSKDTVRALFALHGEEVPEDYDWSDSTSGRVLGLPYRVDDSVDRFALETVK